MFALTAYKYSLRSGRKSIGRQKKW